jgi:hypothetical protein
VVRKGEQGWVRSAIPYSESSEHGERTNRACQKRQVAQKLRAVHESRCARGWVVGRRVGALWALAILLASALAAKTVRAETDVNVPEHCGSPAEFTREVTARLAAGVEIPATVVRIAPQSESYRLEMRVGEEQRELLDADCRELFRAAIVIVVARSANRTGASAPRAEERAPGEPEAAPRTEASPSSHPSFARRWHARIGAGGGVSLGLLPKPVLMLDLEAQALGSELGVTATVRYLAEGETSDELDRGVSVTGFGGQLALSYQPVPMLQARAGVGGYRLTGVGLGSPSRVNDTAWSGGATAGLMLTPPLSELVWAGAGAEAQLNLVRARFEISNYGEVFRVPLFSACIFLRLGWQFF